MSSATIPTNPDVRGFYQNYGIALNSQSNGELITRCPFCVKDAHFYISSKTGQYHCKKCDVSGNGYTFLRDHKGLDKASTLKSLDYYGLLKNRDGSNQQDYEIEATYDYPNLQRELVHQTVRKEGKEFCQRRPDGNGGWIWNLNGIETILYRLPEIVKSETIVICEGEKDADNVVSAYGLQSTTCAGGAGRWKDHYNQWLKGKNVIVLYDRDDNRASASFQKGIKHAVDVANNLYGIANTVKVVSLPRELNNKKVKDISNYIEAGGTKGDFLKLAEKSKLITDTVEILDIESEVGTNRNLFKGDMRCNVNKWLTEDPPELEFIFNGVLIRGTVAGIMAQGGVGKSYLELYFALSCSTGQIIFDKFVPSGPMKVMVLFGEDDEPIVWQRFKWILSDLEKKGISIDRELIKSNLYCVCGISAPLMELEGANPRITDTYRWLAGEVESYQPSLIIIDPKAQWYGLEENSNDYNTQWTNQLKNLIRISHATVLFSHHVTKLDSKSLESTASRGGSALTDNCRWVANMRLIDEKKAKASGIDVPSKYVEFKVTKNNYAPLMPESLYFRKVDNGLLELTNLEAHKFVDITSMIEDILRQDKPRLTIDQLVNKTAGKAIRDRIKDKVGYNVKAKEFEGAVNFGINEGVFKVETLVRSGSKREVKYLVLKDNY